MRMNFDSPQIFLDCVGYQQDYKPANCLTFGGTVPLFELAKIKQVVLEPRVSPEHTSKYVDTVTVFAKTWTKGHWPQDDLWPHICWGLMCESTQIFLDCVGYQQDYKPANCLTFGGTVPLFELAKIKKEEGQSHFLDVSVMVNFTVWKYRECVNFTWNF